jgi:membrane-bound ClpP family serine protease
MFWVLVAAILLIGFLFILAEVLFVPGGILGIVGAIILLYGIYLPYSEGEITGGNITLGLTLLLLVVSLFMSIRAKTWRRVQLDTSIDSKVKKFEEDKLNVGDTGVASSRLNPMGTVRFGDRYIEVTSFDGFTDEGKEVEVMKITKDKIIVKQKS